VRAGRQAVDVAVYAPWAGPLYERGGGPVGGAEVQSAHLARALAERGYRTAHIVSGRNLPEREGDVRILPLSEDYLGGGVGRRRATLSALRAADARVYVQRSAGYETGWVALFARAARRRFVFSSSSTADFVLDRAVARRGGTGLEDGAARAQYLLGLRLANSVVVQTEEQRALARDRRGIDARVIRSFCETQPASDELRNAFVWIGGLAGSKDPLAYLELARRLPEASFRMVAADRGALSGSLAEDVRAAAASLPNVLLVDWLPRGEVLELYRTAVAVVNTSHFEGFPNTFLEGWASGAPALSFRVDPDGVIVRHGLGAVCGGSLDELARAARELWEHRVDADGSGPRDYVARVHDPRVVGGEWARLIEELIGA
jgi:hypothetical protein